MGLIELKEHTVKGAKSIADAIPVASGNCVLS